MSQNLIAAQQQTNETSVVSTIQATDVANIQTPSQDDLWSEIIDPTNVNLPRIPKVLWAFLKDIPQDYQWPCFFSLITGIAPYTQMKVRYRKSEKHPIVLHCYIISESGNGKGAVIRLNKIASELMMKQDRKRLTDYTTWDKMPAKTKTTIPEPPHYKQYMGDQITQASAILEVSLAPDITRLVAGPEIDTWVNHSNKKYGLQTDFLRKAFDGDDVSNSAVHPDSPKVYSTPAKVCVCFAGTRQKMRRFFCDVTDGSLNRGLFPVMPFDPYDINGLQLPDYSQQLLDDLDATCDKLQNMDCSKVYEFAPIEEAINQWLATKKELCQQYKRSLECHLTHRPAVNGFRIGCLLAAIRDSQNVEFFSMKDCCKAAVACAEYAWRAILYNWGTDINKAAKADSTQGDSKNVNHAVFNLLPDIFTGDDVVEERKKMGLSTSDNNRKKILQRWVNSNWIKSLGNRTYQKL